jgi:hypothetical protein
MDRLLDAVRQRRYRRRDATMILVRYPLPPRTAEIYDSGWARCVEQFGTSAREHVTPALPASPASAARCDGRSERHLRQKRARRPRHVAGAVKVVSPAMTNSDVILRARSVRADRWRFKNRRARLLAPECPRACWAFMCGDDGGRCGVGFRSGEEFFLRARRSGAPYCRHSGLDLR